jgi:hypothetical protein
MLIYFSILGFLDTLLVLGAFPSPALLFPVVPYRFHESSPTLLQTCTWFQGPAFISTLFRPRPIHQNPVLDPLRSQAATSHQVIINVVESFCPSLDTLRCDIDEHGTKATPKTPLTIATNMARLGFDCDGVFIQLMCLLQVAVESVPVVAHIGAFITFGRRIVASPHLLEMLRGLVFRPIVPVLKSFRTPHECTAVKVRVPGFALVGVRM